MRLLITLVTIPLAALFTWWGVTGLSVSGNPQAEDHVSVHRKTFRVTLQEKGELKAANSIDVKSEVEGRSTVIWLVPEGSSVKKDDLLVELASDEIEERVQTDKIAVATARAMLESAERQLEILIEQNSSSISKAELKLELASIALKKYNMGDWPQQLQDADFRIKEAEKVHQRAESDLEYASTLREKRFITQSEFEQDEFECYKAEVNLNKARRDKELLIQYTKVQDDRQKNSEVEEARKELDRVRKEADNKEKEQLAKLQARRDEHKLKADRLQKLEEQMSKTKIVAPADGMVVYGDGRQRWWGNNDQIKEGAEVFERQTIMQLPDTSQMKVVLRIHEAETDKIKLGQQAHVEVEGISDRKFTGELTKIAVLADSQNRWLNPELKEYETEITLHESDALLKPGVTSRVEILVDELDDVIAVPVQSVFSKGTKNFVFVGKDVDAVPTEVELGLANADFVEIKSGLAEGQSVLLWAPDILRQTLSDTGSAPQVAGQPAQAADQSNKKAQARRGEGSGSKAPRPG